LILFFPEFFLQSHLRRISCEDMKLKPHFIEFLLILFAIIVGALAGLGALAFMGLIALGQWAFWPAGANFLVQATQAPWWLRLLAPVAGGLALGPVLAYLVPELRGPGISEVMEAAALEDSYIRPQMPLLKTLCTALSIATGSSLGREGPVAGIGAALSSALGRFFGFSPEKVRVALACGAAGGIAATFNAPFAGTLFAVEIILGDIQIAYLGPIALSGFIAVIVTHQIWTGFPVLISPAFELRHTGELGLYLLLGLLGGLLAIGFTRGVYACDTVFRRISAPEWCKPALGGLALGLIGLWCPHVFGVGYDSINLALTGKLALDASALIFLAKFLATAICLGSMSGGVFGPSLFLGAMLGTCLALTWNLLFPQIYINPVDYALVGMATVVCGVTLGPITAILVIFELTKDYRTIVPLLISCTTSLLMVKSLYGYSIYQAKLLRRGIQLVHGMDAGILRTLQVKDCLTSQVETIEEDTTLPEIIEKAEHSASPFLLVLDRRGELSGLLTMADLRQDLRVARTISPGTTATDLMTRQTVTITPEDTLDTALELFEEKNFSCLPVVLPPERKKVVGLLKHEDLVRAYKQRLLRIRLVQKES
jgi:CIC family chloride channel protein